MKQLSAEHIDTEIMKRLAEDPYAKMAKQALADLRAAIEPAAQKVARKYGAKMLASHGGVEGNNRELSWTVGFHWDD